MSADENATVETPEPAAAPPPAGLARGRRGSGTFGLWVMAAVVLVGVVFLVYTYVQHSLHPAVPARAHVESVSAPISASPNNPDNAVSPAYRALVKQDNQARIAAAATQPSSVVVPPLLGGTTATDKPPIVTVTAAPTQPRQSMYSPQGAQNRNDAMSKRLSDLAKRWDTLTPQTLERGAPLDVRQLASARDDDAQAPLVAWSGPALPMLQVMPAVVEVGANSDYPGDVVARLTNPDFDDVKLLGHVTSGGGSSGVADRVVMQFTKLLWRGHYYSATAIGVDPATRIPAVQGDVNYHVLYNVLTNASATFLLGYAAAAQAGYGGYGVGIGNVGGIGGVQGYYYPSPSQIIKSEAAQTLGNTLHGMAFRGSTVTLPAGSAIGVVLTAPIGSVDSNGHGLAAAAGPASGNSAFGPAASQAPAGPVVRSSPDGNIVATASQGTP